jgi:NAD(P)-dependent dehydrogenase (short-subunit alcohol dehydrogenase family)
VLSACPNPDILINNAGGPPPGDFRGVEREGWIQAIDANMLTPIFLIRALIDGMIARGFGRIAKIAGMGAAKEGADRAELDGLSEAAGRDNAQGEIRFLICGATGIFRGEGDVGFEPIGLEAAGQEPVDCHIVTCNLPRQPPTKPVRPDLAPIEMPNAG